MYTGCRFSTNHQVKITNDDIFTDTHARSHTHTHLYTQYVGVLCQQGGADDAPFVLRLLEMRVGKQEEHLAELSAAEVVRQILHCVRPDTRDVAVAARVLSAQSHDAFLHVVRNLHTNLKSEHQCAGKQRRQLNCKHNALP